MTTDPRPEPTALARRLAIVNDLTIILSTARQVERRVELDRPLSDEELARYLQTIQAAAIRISNQL
ncbi:MAG TPA: hypothetical protein VGT61_12040 [Thermomicrobiales bacterium]|jgi:hypothetical protein|nr:hypothetical protein [Thermomicrobiales bacterium]